MMTHVTSSVRNGKILGYVVLNVLIEMMNVPVSGALANPMHRLKTL